MDNEVMFFFLYCVGLVLKLVCKMEEKEEDYKCVLYIWGFVV